MCKYRCYYYAGCRHQGTILHDYCDKATSAQASSSAHAISPAATSPLSDTQAGAANEDRDATPRASSPADIPSPSPTMSTYSSHHTTASNVSIGSSAPTSFASLAEDTSDTSSIQLEYPLRRHSEPSACSMASLPPFMRDNFKSLFSGRQVPVSATTSFGDKCVKYDDQENVQPIDRAEQDVPSYPMHTTTNLIDDRLSEATSKKQHVSYSSTVSDDSQSEFDAIERDIDALKQHIAEIRSGSRSGRSTPTGYQDQTQSKPSSTRTRISGPVAHTKESAAARLQREHQKAQEDQTRASTLHRSKQPPPPPSPHDFPELGRKDAGRRPRAFTADADEGKPSYANMATTGMMEAISTRFTDTNGLSGATSRSARNSFPSSAKTNDMTMEDHEFVMSSASPKCERMSTNRGQTPSLVGRSPRFAQPTKAHSQRADATMRKDSVSSKVSPIGSPTKSGRVLPQVQTKRSALPGGWLSSPEVSPTTEVSSPSITGTVDASSPSSTECWQIISHSLKETATATEPTLRKKTSSYMSPTKATTLRSVATLGQENIKHTSPRIKKPVARIDTKVSPGGEVTASATSGGPDSAVSGTTYADSAISSPDVAILTERGALSPWNAHGSQKGHDMKSSTSVPTSEQVTVQGSVTQKGVDLYNIDTAQTCARQDIGSATSDPASAVFGHGGLHKASTIGECVNTERSLQASKSQQRPEITSDATQTAVMKAVPSRAVPIVQPKTSVSKPMPHKLHAPRRSTIGPLGLVADDLAAAAKARGLPMPANTVAKRRVSHGHLLTPITSKLQSLGLLKQQPVDATSPIISQSTTFSTALQHVRQLLPETPQKLPSTESAPAPAAPQVRTKAVPPHLRRKHNTSSGDEPTPSQNETTGLGGNNGTKSVTEELEAQKSQIPSLRATAQEFTPMWKPKTIEQELGLLDWEGWFSYRSPEEWNALHPGIRAAIQAIRDYKCKGGRPPSGTFPGMSPTKIRSKTANQRFWADLMRNQAPTSGSNSPASMTPSDVVAAMQKTITQHAAGGGAEAGQVLKPEINPETNAIQWVMQEPDGRKVSVSFGRAAAPAAAREASDAFCSPNTVTISPLSTDTSPRYNASLSPQNNEALRTPSGQHGRRGWSIASALKDPSGWAIGDGREIRYVGNGNINPGTNFSPDAPYQQGFREGPDQAPRMIGEDQDNRHSSLPLAPRSREQWAKLLPLGRMPCGNMEITQATEQIPSTSMGGPQLYGFCGPCSGKTH